MIDDSFRFPLCQFDLDVFDRFVPADHHLRQALAVIDWEQVERELRAYYSDDKGRPTRLPLVMFKLQYLMFHYNLSDRQVMARAETDMAFRYFLQLGTRDQLPHDSTLSRFRARLGSEGFRTIFDLVIAQARAQGLVKDRLRIKDATHVIASVAIPTTLQLLAEVRDKLLEVAEPFDAERVEGEIVAVQLHREASRGLSLEERLESRVTHLREIWAWTGEIPAPDEGTASLAWRRLVEARKLVEKILSDRDRPSKGDAIRSATDPEVRRNKHGQWYDGYLMDMIVDVDSELITVVTVLPANGNEGANAAHLIHMEQTAHGNTIEAISIDGAGYSGPVLRELSDPEGLALKVFVPVKSSSEHVLFTSPDFVEDTQQGVVVCPAGKRSRYRQTDKRKNVDKGLIYRFARSTCQGCQLLSQCMAKSPKNFGKTVRKSRYQREFEQLEQLSQTEAFASVRREHQMIERKFTEPMNLHGGRRARYRGRLKVELQQLLAAMTTNIKRIVKLSDARELQPTLT